MGPGKGRPIRLFVSDLSDAIVPYGLLMEASRQMVLYEDQVARYYYFLSSDLITVQHLHLRPCMVQLNPWQIYPLAEIFPSRSRRHGVASSPHAIVRARVEATPCHV